MCVLEFKVTCVHRYRRLQNLAIFCAFVVVNTLRNSHSVHTVLLSKLIITSVKRKKKLYTERKKNKYKKYIYWKTKTKNTDTNIYTLNVFTLIHFTPSTLSWQFFFYFFTQFPADLSQRVKTSCAPWSYCVICKWRTSKNHQNRYEEIHTDFSFYYYYLCFF